MGEVRFIGPDCNLVYNALMSMQLLERKSPLKPDIVKKGNAELKQGDKSMELNRILARGRHPC
jgi:hypothetical protein